MFIDPDLSAGFTKHLSLGWMQTWDDGANQSSFEGSLRPQFQQYLASGGLAVSIFHWCIAPNLSHLFHTV